MLKRSIMGLEAEEQEEVFRKWENSAEAGSVGH